ncbi:4-deoxy-L-threo-5-hexosulose-uronate ketol-isomerase [Leucobacter exalbidus]|uniref:4-deoxy-L-threo-5-hexosulose-uronate ketol-isomerase n=1 Tax=Leucobacter exalbidus TaxID=662960 RepID=A0A940PPI2_9MICO|nr:5-dehydro-4-deoxy-D-glucuronate isomerase [Leucobacter exalbidus]MBP1326800.1 4-deoxy-L-threo-5-hexosulose-uronate ketol-isomerase [Leucobacter exalbidus]
MASNMIRPIGPDQIVGFSQQELRDHLLIEKVLVPGETRTFATHYDRIVAVGAVPTDAPLKLEAVPEIRSEFFLEHREIGFVNVGAQGTIVADGVEYDMAPEAVLYLGRGTRDVTFYSADGGTPAKYYGFSAPAHTAFPNTLAGPDEGTIRELGDQTTANTRRLRQVIHENGIRSCQIVMGVTRLQAGSMWNTMPAHTHERRTEFYLYFDVPANERVVHLMGEPEETRHMMVASEQLVMSPSWSIHSGVGTQAYAFVWAMAGENQSFDDMDHVQISEMV